MKTKQLPLAILAVILLISACKKPPEASFTHNSNSYEKDDTVYFISTSTDATSHDWDFGDGSTSTEESTFHIYNETGTYTVKLTATNDDGSDEASEAVTIKDPTILAFQVTEGETETAIENCAVMIFETQSDWENIENPVDGDVTDSYGFVFFYYVKPIVYYVYAFKEVSNGYWIFGGSTGTNYANQTNVWWIPAELVTEKKSDMHNPADEIKILKQYIK